jgi:nickel-type superoxide dismutase maturation protease
LVDEPSVEKPGTMNAMAKTLARTRRLWRRAAAVSGLIALCGVLAEGYFLRCEVEGHSMIPALLAGDRILFRRRLPGEVPKVGTVVAFEDPRERETRLLIKRVAQVDGHQITVVGDNTAASTDSRDFGPIRAENISWIYLRRYRHAQLGTGENSQNENDL